jgi:hypothetical protein
MKIPNFTFTRKSIQNYGAQHVYAQVMFGDAGDDYAAARCLVFNLMVSGFPLFCQSIEKFLKAIIFLETGQKPIAKGSDRHNPYALKEELQKTTDYGLDKYDAVLKKLYGNYQHRYYDNPDRSGGMGSDEVDGFDELWMYLFEKAPFPIEVKYRLSFPAMLFEERTLQHWPTYRHWVIFQNKAIAPKLAEMQEMYLAVREHYIKSPN